MLKNKKGFTLIELLIALVIGSFLILGITGTYSTVQSSVQISKELENAQEVLRFTSKVFTRSLKQTNNLVVTDPAAGTLLVQQVANTRSCVGTQPTVDYNETFTFIQPNLFCEVTDTAGGVLTADSMLLTGITNLGFATNGTGDLVTLTVQPDNLPENFNNSITIDISLTSIIIP